MVFNCSRDITIIGDGNFVTIDSSQQSSIFNCNKKDNIYFYQMISAALVFFVIIIFFCYCSRCRKQQPNDQLMARNTKYAHNSENVC